ncbi:MAG TPA: DegT/DnrJ/EryC1/StrS family aminotransferase [Solirubrobacterales bacterium]
MKVAANDFTRQWGDVRDDALAAMDRVGESGWLVLGAEVDGFEREFATWWGASHAVGVASGLDALEIALRCAGVQPGDRILTTPLTAFATTLAVIRAGAEPVWCDVDESGGLDIERADEALHADPSIRAVLPVHLYGHPLDPVGLERLASEHDIVVIEDCAQSTGAERDGRPTALAGIAAAVSLYPTKNLGAMGDGGVLLTEDEGLAEKAKRLRDYGQSARYEHTEAGLNSRLDEVQAAILRTALLPRLNRWLSRRRRIASRYVEGLAGSALQPIAPQGGESAHHLFPVKVKEGDPGGVVAGLIDQGVSVGRHYPFLCPDQRAARGVGSAVDSLAVARRISKRELSLPIHPYLEDEEVEAVIEACLVACA